MKLNVADRENLQKRVKILIPQMKKSEIVKHFEKEGIARRTIYNTINRMQNEESTKDKKTSRPTSWTAARKRKLKRLVNNRKGVSQRGLGKKFGLDQSVISRKIAEMGISNYKREKTPKYTEKQRQNAENNCRKLANLFYRSSCVIIQDDEKYFCLDRDNMPGSALFYSDDKSKCPDNVRFKGQEKYPKMVMVWIAISPRGLS